MKYRLLNILLVEQAVNLELFGRSFVSFLLIPDLTDKYLSYLIVFKLLIFILLHS